MYNEWSHGSVGSTYWYLCKKAHGRMAQLVEHIVHIDGVTGSSPVATTMTRKPLKIKGFRVFFLPVFETVFNAKNGFRPKRHTFG